MSYFSENLLALIRERDLLALAQAVRTHEHDLLALEQAVCACRHEGGEDA